MWMAPPTSQPRRRPASIYTGIHYGLGDERTTMPYWGHMNMQQQVRDSSTIRTTSVPQELLPLAISGHSKYRAAFLEAKWMSSTLTKDGADQWTHPSCGDALDFQTLDADGPIGQAYTTDDAVPIIDLRYSNIPPEAASMNSDNSMGRQGMSGSSPASGPLSDLPSSYDDFPTTLSEAPSYSSEYLSTSNRTSLMSSIHLSPVASPRATNQTRPDQVRTQSRGRATPSPRPSARSAPYSLEGSKNQRWSTGSYASSHHHNRRQSPLVYQEVQDAYSAPQRMSLQAYQPLPSHSSIIHVGGIQGAQSHPFGLNGQPMYSRHDMMLPSHPGMYLDGRPFEQPPPLPSQGLFKMLQSNGDPHTLHSHYTDLSDPPDLFGALQEEQVPPPEEDMNPADASLSPYEQDMRFEGDLYTPKWVRGHGNKREGWCGICKPGRWLVLKNSAFWYDKSFTHGISAATGSPFEEPLDTRRMDGNPDVWEGLCSSCNDWVPLVSSKKKGTTWFRHAYKVNLGEDHKHFLKSSFPVLTSMFNSVIRIKRLKTHRKGGAKPTTTGQLAMVFKYRRQKGIHTPQSHRSPFLHRPV